MLLHHAATEQRKEELSWKLYFGFWQIFVPKLFRCLTHSSGCELSPCIGADYGRGEADLAPCSALELFPGRPSQRAEA